MLPCYHVTMLPCHHVTMSPCCQVRYEALQWKVDPHCAIALLLEVPPWGVMLRLGDYACCQLLCNVQAELGRDLGISLLPPHQGRPRERGKGAVLPSGTYTPSPSGCLGAGRARRRKPHKSPQWLGPAFSAESMELPQLLAAPIQCSSAHPLRATAPPSPSCRRASPPVRYYSSSTLTRRLPACIRCVILHGASLCSSSPLESESISGDVGVPHPSPGAQRSTGGAARVNYQQTMLMPYV